ncbi:hypothetical protein SAMN04488128_102524 [Chitinophaga eiseniae]|uniref:Uncharacterized protein n=1 Tax=Chitinophaga eiseniae TaxID=634771 RepID=A0A1T4QQC2_9BACT|nr:hypothetical protein SAMN04488128_102524 [Chitinophaga eiseniae]
MEKSIKRKLSYIVINTLRRDIQGYDLEDKKSYQLK